MCNKLIAVVTGSSRGIGLQIAISLVQNGYHTILSATKDATQMSDILEKIKTDGLSAEYIKCDVTDKSDCDNMFNEIVTRHGKIDLWVNNAGVSPKLREDILEAGEDDYNRVLDVNLNSVFRITQHVAKIMLKMRENDNEARPRIINIGSISAYAASVNRASYCIAKAGVSMMTSLFASRLTPHGVGVFEVRPGIIQTDMTQCVLEKYESMIENGLTPILRMGVPNDVAQCVLAIALGYLDFAAGQIINADGGFHLRRL